MVRRRMIFKKHSVYFIMGSQNVKTDPKTILQTAIDAGIDFFQFREKGEFSLKEEKKEELGKRLQTLCQKNNIPFIVNDDVDLAFRLNADGIHVGQDDLPLSEVEKLTKSDLFVGLSTSTLEEAIEAEKLGVDYIGFGPIFNTKTKIDAKKPVGLEALKEVSESVSIPIVAIGGISINNANDCFRAGAHSIATISAITNSNNIKETVNLLKMIKE